MLAVLDLNSGKMIYRIRERKRSEIEGTLCHTKTGSGLLTCEILLWSGC
jgi:hypothetical protein